MKKIKLNLFSIFTIVFIIQFVSATPVWSQVCKPQKKIDIGVATNLTNTSSGLGSLTETNVFLKYERSEFKVGIVLQNQYGKISGYNLQYRYYLLDNDEINLFLLLYTMQSKNVNLRSEINNIFHRFNYSEVKEFEKFDIQEYYAGFGIQVKLVRNLFIDSKIGIGGYMSQVLNEDLRDKNTTYHFDNDFGVLLSIGLRYKISLKEKSKRWP